MPSHPAAQLHIYDRDIQAGERTSLSVLAGHIAAGARVLDLGCGSGAVGRFLAARDGAAAGPIDGLTISAEEAQLAQAHYRRVELANLDQCRLPELFEAASYDVIVCADVLEHVRESERVLAECRELLAPGGRVLLSIPNAGYCGLLAELMAGEFRYRKEGLLDETHVRFFTRRTLHRFLVEAGYAADDWDTVTRELPASEFHLAFDALPPAVANYLLALPDALTYQFIVVARPLPEGDVAGTSAPPAPEQLLPVQALFTAQLFFSTDEPYAEQRKLGALGIIGQERQTLRFALPLQPMTRLRLDPADRPGFLHLHALRLRSATGELLWQWDSADAGTLLHAHQQGIVAQPPVATGGPFLLLLHGDDPWIELPLTPELAANAAGGALEVELGWPMSADFLALAGTVQRLQFSREHADRQRAALSAQLEQAQTRSRALQQRLEEALSHHQQLPEQLIEARSEQEDLQDWLDEAQAYGEMPLEQLDAAQTERDRLQGRLDEAQAQREQLQDQFDQAQATHQALEDTHQSALARLHGAEQHNETLRQRTRELLARLQQLGAERDEAFALIRSIENSTVFRVTRPAVHAKMWLDRQLGIGSARSVQAMPQPVTPASDTVDIILPVYRGLADTQLCLRSVLASRCRTPWRLIVINDASPEPELSDWLRQQSAGDPRITLLENEHNLGFVGTVNRGMALSGEHDVLLLNSDTEVAGDWLDRIRAAAYREPRIASVTPFSNNATICSYPRFCQDNSLPPGWSTAELDALCARTLAGQAVDIPTAVGFCMYIRRAALDTVGLFDVDNFGKGYGEENDFCVRASAAGWRHLHALDSFVFHSGGVSFGAGKSPRERAAMETMRRLHPNYELDVMRFIQCDPAAPARAALDLARVARRGLPLILAVMHDRDGGTLLHVQQLARTLAEQAGMLMLRPAPGQQVVLGLVGPDASGAELRFALPDEFEALLDTLRLLGVRHLHFHHLLGHHPLIRQQLAARLGVTHDFSVHDFYTACPQISMIGVEGAYCGELGLAQCHDCLGRNPAPGQVGIEAWREDHLAVVNGARHVIAPSRDALERLRHYAPQAHHVLVPHLENGIETGRPPAPRALAADAPLKIVVLGALSVIKGADTLEELAVAARRAGAPLQFHLLGYAYRALRAAPGSALTVHGAYREDELPALLEQLAPDLVWFPARVPETFSYTLSAALRAGLPVVGPDLGAFPERLAGRAWSWIEPWDRCTADWLDFFLQLRQRHFLTALPPAIQAAPRARNPAGPDGAPAPAQASASWYRRDYLLGIPTAGETAGLDPGLIARHLRPAAPAGASAAGRSATLSLLVRLRAHPLLAPLARRIPPGWQRRVKNWLTH